MTEASTGITVINPLERLNGEIKRRTHVVGICPNAWAAPPTKAIVRRVGAILLEQADECAVHKRHTGLETLGSVSDGATGSLSVIAA